MGTCSTQLIGLIRHFTAMCAMGYMRMTGQVRWIARSWNMIDVVRVGTRTCPPYSATDLILSACNMHAVAPIALGGKQFLVGQCYEFFFRGFPIRQTMNAADADRYYSMR